MQVWNSSLTWENINDLERTQKSFCKFVLQQKYTNYDNALIELDLISLAERRKLINLKFAKDGIKTGKLIDLFPEKKRQTIMNLRQPEKYKVIKFNTERMRKSSIVYMQMLLNEDVRNEQKEK